MVLQRRAGDTRRRGESHEGNRREWRDLMQNLNALSKQIGAIVNDMQSGRGTLGALLEDRAVYDHADQTHRSASTRWPRPSSRDKERSGNS